MPNSLASNRPCRGCGNAQRETVSYHLNGTTRPSCLRCVEKHVGAALVLIAEEMDGYINYLLIVGHLHEAADESQAWPDLHNAIRDARHEYQERRTFSKIRRIGSLIERIGLISVNDGDTISSVNRALIGQTVEGGIERSRHRWRSSKRSKNQAR